MGAIKKSFEIILNSNKEESRIAARQIRKLLYSSRKDQSEFDDIRIVVDGAFGEYYKITEDWRQENFVMAISVIYYLHDKNNSPDFLFLWFLQLLQHQNGYIRHAAVKMIADELGPLTVHIRFPGDKRFSKENLISKKADEILFFLFVNLHNLFSVWWLPKYRKYKYINSLPASPYKSIQMVLAEMEDMCGTEYLNDF
ncbi:MAG: hypothetical protein PF488_02490 [Patescibacteria group bacterium]|jgi:hypothetical protein|nr:hypothetical protein [Patescibacteria group bacterium]